MNQNIATFSASFGITERVAQDMNRITQKVQQNAGALEQALADPIIKAERQMGLLASKTDRYLAQAISGRSPFTDRQLNEVRLMNQEMERLLNLMGELGRTQPAGFGHALETFGVLRGGLSSINNIIRQQQPMTAARVMPEYGPNYIYTPNIHGPATPAQFRTFSRTVSPERNYDLPKGFMPYGNLNLYGRDYGQNYMHAFQVQGPDIPDWLRITPRLVQEPKEYGLPSGFTPFSKLDFQRSGYNTINTNRIYGPPVPPGFEQQRDSLRQMERQMDFYFRAEDMNKVKAGRKQFAEVEEKETSALRIRKSKELETSFRAEEVRIESLAKAWGKLSAEELKNKNISIRARSEAGINTTVEQEALRRVVDPRSSYRYGKGSSDHMMRYSAQNIAFGLEDFLISSQYGGIGAGFRAITNNATAVAAATTGRLTPLMSAGLVGGTAVIGAGAAVGYDYVNSLGIKDDEREGIREYVQRRDRDVSMKYQTRRFADSLTGTSTAASGFQAAQAAYEEANARQMSVHRDMMEIVKWKQTPMPTALHGERTNMHEPTFYEKMDAGFDSFVGGWTGMYGRTSGRSLEQIEDYQRKMEEFNALEKQYGPLSAASNQKKKEMEIARSKFDEGFQSDVQTFGKNRMQRNELAYWDDLERQGVLLHPMNRFDTEQVLRDINKARELKDVTDPMQRQIIEEKYRQQDVLAKDDLAMQEKVFEERKRDRQLDQRDRLNKYETNPLKKYDEQAAITRQRMMNDESFLTEADKEKELAAYDKYVKKQREKVLSYNTTPEGIEVGSANDIRLRGQFFDKGKNMGEPLIPKLDEIKKVMEKVVAALTGKKQVR